MTLQEILKAQGVSDDQIAKIEASMKENKVYTTIHENMDVRYPKLKTEHESLTKQHGEATTLIEQMKKEAGSSAGLKDKISGYESTIAQLQADLSAAKLESAVKLALIGANAQDVDYMAFHLQKEGKLELDESGNIKGIDDKLTTLKTKFPTMFATEGKKAIQVQKLPGNAATEPAAPKSLAEALQQRYEEQTT